MPANLENSAVATGLEKVSFHSNPNEAQCQRLFKLLQITLISHASKVMLKILQARLQQYMNQELPDVQAWFRKGRGTRDQITNILYIIEKGREFQKNVCFNDAQKSLTVCYGQRFVTLCRRQGSRSCPTKRNAKGKMVVWGGFTNSWGKKEKQKAKEEKKNNNKYAHLNSEFQRTARRDKKAFFSDQCKDRGK